MKNQIIKKVLGVIGLTTLVIVLFTNTSTLNSSTSNLSLANLISLNTANAEWPWDTQYAYIQVQKRCAYYYPDGSFTSSVELVCETNGECQVPLNCNCTSVPCGQV